MLAHAAAAIAVMLTVVPACGGGNVGARGPGHPLPPYIGHEAELFDDAIEGKAVGYELDRGAPPPMNDNALRERAQVGDTVVRARVTTVTSKDEDKGRTWQIGFHTLEKLGGAGSAAADFTVQVEPNGPSAGILRALGGQLLGTTFVVFLREFAVQGVPDESALHFHATQDGKANIAAVHSAFTTDRVR
jgi:hypothetical protein